MLRLLVQFADAELADFRWATLDETTTSDAIDWRQTSADELPSVVAQNPHPVVIIIPQQCVYITEVALPEGANRQLLSAIEYQVEDQLAQDIETQHFALGDTSENPVALAVVSRPVMERCMTLARSLDLRLTQIIPELFLCPLPEEGAALIEGYGGSLLRYGKYRGLKCNEQTLPAMLEQLRRDVDFDTITCFEAETGVAPAIDKFTLLSQPLSSTRPGFVDAPVIDLQQRDYRLSSAWQTLAEAWKWVALLFAILLVVGGFNKAIALNDLSGELGDIEDQQYELLKPYLPADTSPDANLKKLLIARVKQLQSNQREQGFLKLLLDFTGAKNKFPNVKVSRITYQGNLVSIEISSKQLNDIEALVGILDKQGVNASLENLNIKPDLSSGRLLLRGGDDV